MTRGRVPRVRRRAAARPARDRGARRARHHRHRARPDRHLGLRRPSAARALRRPPARLGPTSGTAARRARARTRTRSRACTSSSTSTAWSCSRSRTPARRRAAHDGRVRAPPGARPAPARRPQAARDQPAGGHVVHARRQPAALAEVVAARRLQPPRGHGPAHRRLRRRRAHAPRRAPALVRRDGRPVPRPDARPLPPHRVRHRRVGPRLHDDLARARLRLPRRDRLPRRGAARHARRAVRDPQRDLHPRGGQRGPLEARRRRRPARRSGASAGWCSPSTSPSPTTSTSSTGASTRTATSSARCARPGSWSRRTSPRASSRPTARSSTSAPTRRSTSTSSSRGSTSTSTARPTRSTRPSPRRSRSAPDNPHGLALVQRDTPLRTEQEGKQDYDWLTQRAWKVVNEHVANGLGTPVGYKLVPGAAIPPMLDPDSPVLGRAEAIGHTLWVTPFDRGRALAVRRVRRPEPPGRRRRPARLDRARPLDRGHGRRPVVRVRDPPHHPPGGVARDVGGHSLVLAQASRVLRPQPGARRRAGPRQCHHEESAMSTDRDHATSSTASASPRPTGAPPT